MGRVFQDPREATGHAASSAHSLRRADSVSPGKPSAQCARQVGSQPDRGDHGRIDPDDVVQSAYRSFFIHARNGAYVFERAGDLWRLLAQITLYKLHGQIEHQTAQRRNPEREMSQDQDLQSLMSTEPTSEAVIAAIDQLHLIMKRLSETERKIISFRLQGKSIAEIAADIQRSQRTVRRILQELEELMSREFRRIS